MRYPDLNVIVISISKLCFPALSLKRSFSPSHSRSRASCFLLMCGIQCFPVLFVTCPVLRAYRLCEKLKYSVVFCHVLISSSLRFNLVSFTEPEEISVLRTADGCAVVLSCGLLLFHLVTNSVLFNVIMRYGALEARRFFKGINCIVL